MADEKRNDQIVDSNELSEKDLEQAAGGTDHAAAVNKADGNRAALNHASVIQRR